MIISLLCVFSLAICCAHAEKTNNRSVLDISALLQNFQVKHLKTINISPKVPFYVLKVGYDRRVRPGYGGPPVSVGVSLYVLSVGEISYKFMDFTFDMYFRQFWTDERLTFDAKEV